MLFLSEGSAEGGSLHYLLGAAAAFVLWDCGVVYDNAKLRLLLNLHHLGAVIAYIYQPGEAASRAGLNTLLFAWGWAIHVLPFIQDVMLPWAGLSKTKGQKYTFMEVLRYLYGAVTVYCYHLYLNAEGQPGLGYNYQTLAAGFLLIGRYLAHDNWKMVDWARRVEVPGVMFVTLAHLMGNDYKFAASVTVALVIGIVSLKTAQFTPTPEKYSLTPEIRNFLSSVYGQKPDIDPILPFPIEMVRSWWAGNPTWSKDWPLHEAALFGDVDTIRQSLEQRVDADLQMSDWHNTTPAGFGSFFGRLDAVILLLQKGVDPYKQCNHPQFVGMVSTNVMQLLQKHRHTKKFTDKLHAIAMKASPPKTGDSVVSRVVAVLKRF